jgi:adenylosuccinate lyase
MARDWAEVPMLARTHGQAATPTRVGKELHVFLDRMRGQFDLLQKVLSARALLNTIDIMLINWQVPMSAKFGGATGQFNAHVVAFPHVDWPAFADK